MNSTLRDVVVVGGGLGGATVVTTLRAEGYDGRVVLLGAEPYTPYERPPLSKGYLLGDAGRDEALVRPRDWYAANGVDLRTGTTAVALDRAARQVRTAGDGAVRYDAVVLATGAEPRRLGVPGAHLAGVHALRTLDDADLLLADFRRAGRVAVVGGGWIGLETAAAARRHGADVTVLEQGDAPLGRVLGPELGGMFAALHRDHGVDVRTRTTVERLLTEDGLTVSGVGVVDRATGRSSVVPADVVVVGVGVSPRTALAAGAGLEVVDGVRADEHLRTSDPAVLAVGDVAEAWRPHLGRHLRVEHWANAIRQGEVAARTVLGIDAVDDRPPYFYTDQYELGMEYVGWADPSRCELVVRGSLAEHRLCAFWLLDERVVAAANVDVWDVSEDLEALVRSGARVDPARLRDDDVPLTALAA